MLSWRKSLLVAAVACTSALRVGVSPRVAPAVGHAEPATRRDALFGGLAALALPAAPALAKIESVNPGNNYYFPMARTPVKRPGWRLVALASPMIQRGPAHWQRVFWSVRCLGDFAAL